MANQGQTTTSPPRPEISPITIESDSEDGRSQKKAHPQNVQKSDPGRIAQQLQTPQPLRATVSAASRSHPLVYDPASQRAIADVVSHGLHFLQEIRTKSNLGVDEKFRGMLKDPFPKLEKPLALNAKSKLPKQIIDYFTAMCFHTNKNLAVAAIWLDLRKSDPQHATPANFATDAQCDVYIPFAKVCELHVVLLHNLNALFNNSLNVAPVFQQRPETQRMLFAHLASARLLHNYAQTDAGRKQISTMEMTIDGKRTSDDNTAMQMLENMQYKSWLHYLEDDGKMQWLARVDPRSQ